MTMKKLLKEFNVLSAVPLNCCCRDTKRAIKNRLAEIHDLVLAEALEYQARATELETETEELRDELNAKMEELGGKEYEIEQLKDMIDELNKPREPEPVPGFHGEASINALIYTGYEKPLALSSGGLPLDFPRESFKPTDGRFTKLKIRWTAEEVVA